MPKSPDMQEVVKALTSPVNAVLLATAYYECERERVDKIQCGILAARPYMSNPELTKQPSERITDPRHSYLMLEADFADYHAKCQAIHLDNGFADAARGYCPALVAESLKTAAEHNLVAAAGDFFPGITVNKLLCGTKGQGGLETLQQFIDLCIKLVVNAPGYRPVRLSA